MASYNYNDDFTATPLYQGYLGGSSNNIDEMLRYRKTYLQSQNPEATPREIQQMVGDMRRLRILGGDEFSVDPISDTASKAVNAQLRRGTIAEAFQPPPPDGLVNGQHPRFDRNGPQDGVLSQAAQTPPTDPYLARQAREMNIGGPAALTQNQMQGGYNQMQGDALDLVSNANGQLVPRNDLSITNPEANAILSNDTDDTGGYNSAARQAALTTSQQEADGQQSAMMVNTDPARGTNPLDITPSGTLSWNGNPVITIADRHSLLLEAFNTQNRHGAAALTKEHKAALDTTDPEELTKVIRESTEQPALSPEQQMDDARNQAATFAPAAAAPAALTTGTAEVPTNNNNGALSQTVNNAATAAQSYTGNQRGSNLPDMKIGRGERLMRMGIAGLAAGGLGGDKQFAAMGAAYADVNAENRDAEMAQFKIEEDRRAAEIKARAAGAKAGGSGGGDASVSARIALDNAYDVIKGFDKFDGYESPVGWSYWLRKGWDNISGNEQATIRLKIAKMKVDSTLSRIAQTKGAISEKEMEIFASDQPSWTANETIWRKWINDYIGALKIMHTNLANGTKVSGGTSGGTSGGNQETEDLVKKYSN